MQESWAAPTTKALTNSDLHGCRQVVQRLIEMEKYRVLALMAQPLATQVCVRVMARGTKMTIPGFIASLSGVTIRYLLASTP